jgi:predicted 2-oxoglutarate/Fe(II)-dependent dioxygenase YbiX
MSKRLQVILDDDEMKEIAALARTRKMTISGWVRTALREARSRYPHIAGDRKIQVVRAAIKHGFPTSDMDKMLAEIESGYLSGSSK